MSIEQDRQIEEEEEADKFSSLSEDLQDDHSDVPLPLMSPTTPPLTLWASRSPTPIGGRLSVSGVMPSLVYAPRPYSAPKSFSHS